VTVRALADLSQGARGRIVELRLPPGRRALPSSPLRPGATVYVAEATGGRWLHVRIDYREYSIPLGVAEGVLIDVPEAAQPPSADAAALDAAAFRSRYRLP
jgi:FeoA domain